jgi:hypothetical protein
MNLPRPSPLALRTCIALALPLLMTACGGGDTLQPPANPVPPPDVVRGPTTFQAASLVLGQPDFESGEANNGDDRAQTLRGPAGMAVTPAGGLLLADSSNNRVLFFSPMPSASAAGANAVLGQTDLQGTVASVSQDGMTSPSGLAVGAGRLAVADRNANRVLIYDQIPTPGSAMPRPSVVLGQENFDLSEAGCGVTPLGAPSLNNPASVAITPTGQLIVADTRNHRVLIWDGIPGLDDQNPALPVVLGQETLGNCIANDFDQDGVSDTDASGRSIASEYTLAVPSDLWTDGVRLVVADSTNNRVLIWNTLPTTSFEPANVVLGHLTFTNTSPNSEQDGGGGSSPTARTLNFPKGVHSDGISLAVADTDNHRVLIWNTFPTANGQRADVVLGHESFEESATNDGDGDEVPDAPSSQILHAPSRVLLTPDALFVSDTNHHRVLMFRR